MKKLVFEIKIEVGHDVDNEKMDHLESNLNRIGTQLCNLLTTKVREAVKMSNGEIVEPETSHTATFE